MHDDEKASSPSVMHTASAPCGLRVITFRNSLPFALVPVFSGAEILI
jgi:hypothetical protein